MSPISSDLTTAFARVESNRLFHLRIVSHTGARAEIAMPVKRAFTQEGGVVHGGLVTLVADTAAVYALLPELPAGQTMTSIELKMNFLRPALPDRGELVARAAVVRRGRRVGVCEVDVFQADTAVATGLFTYLIYDAES